MSRKRRRRPARPKPLPNILLDYDSAYSLYPETMRVCFSDGTTGTYYLRVDQPAPVIERIEIVRTWKHGYKGGGDGGG